MRQDPLSRHPHPDLPRAGGRSAPSRIHLAAMPAWAGTGRTTSWEISLGRQRRRPCVAFRSPKEVQAVLWGLRYLDRTGASIRQMGDYLMAGRAWSGLRRESPLGS